MIVLYFLVAEGRVFHYKVEDFTIDDGFYHFVDITTGKRHEIHESLYRGKSEANDP